MTPGKFGIALGLIVAAALAGCQTTTSGGVVGGERKQLLLVSSQELDRMASQSYAKLLSESAKKNTLNQDQALLRRLRAVAGRSIA
ncbi:MAG: hypothetical protein AAB150_09680 [Pseudomonadota bacterium]